MKIFLILHGLGLGEEQTQEALMRIISAWVEAPVLIQFHYESAQAIKERCGGS